MMLTINFIEKESVYIKIDNFNCVDANNGAYLIVVGTLLLHGTSLNSIKVIAYSHSEIKSWFIGDE